MCEGWVRAGLPARLRYVLETLHLEQGVLAPHAQRAALELLCHVADHSPSLAAQLSQAPRLLLTLRGLLEAEAAPSP